MIQVSDKYLENIKADTELIKCRAELSFTPPGANEGATISTTEQGPASQNSQLNNGSFGMDEKWATLEPNRIVLDGSMTFIPENNERQIGFMSASMCDESGVFAEPEKVSYLFNSVYDIAGVSVWFDDLGGEWATELDIVTYDENLNVSATLAYENSSTMFFAEIKQQGVKLLELVIKKWNIGKRFCKVSQMAPGIVLSFASQGILGLEFEEKIDPFSNAISFPETRVIFDNTDNEFNIINPNGMITYLRQKMKVVSKLDLIAGSRTDSVSMGNFYLYSFPKTDQANEAKVACRPAMAFETGMYKAPGTGLQTVQDAVDILFANIHEPVEIDEELKNISVNQYIGDDIPIVTAMAYLAIACCGYWKFNRDGSYELKKWKLPETMLNSVDFDNMWAKPSISMEEKYSSCKTKYYTWDGTNEILKGHDVEVTTEESDGTSLSISSYFICSEKQAQTVAQAFLDYKNLRLTHSASYRGDMSIEASDGITIQNDFEHSEVIVLTHSLVFDTEGLTGSIVGRGLN